MTGGSASASSSALTDGASVVSVASASADKDIGFRRGPPSHRNKMARDEERSRIDFFVAKEKMIEEMGGPEIYEAHMAASWLRRGFNADGTSPVVPLPPVIAPVPPPVVAPVPLPVVAFVPHPRAAPLRIPTHSHA